MPGALFLAAAHSAALCFLISGSELRLAEHQVRISDIVDLGCLDEAQKSAIAPLSLYEAPANQNAFVVTRRALANLVRRRAPLLSGVEIEHPDGEMRIVFGARLAQRSDAAPSAQPGEPPQPIAFGETLTLQMSLGSVTIERNVTAMQASNGRGDVFVKDSDGHIFAVSASALRPVDGRS